MCTPGILLRAFHASSLLFLITTLWNNCFPHFSNADTTAEEWSLFPHGYTASKQWIRLQPSDSNTPFLDHYCLGFIHVKSYKLYLGVSTDWEPSHATGTMILNALDHLKFVKSFRRPTFFPENKCIFKQLCTWSSFIDDIFRGPFILIA